MKKRSGGRLGAAVSAAALLAGGLVGVAAPAHATSWGLPVNLSATGQNAYDPQVAMSSDGTYQTITWRRSNGTNDIIQAATSSDNGATWTTTDLSATGQKIGRAHV